MANQAHVIGLYAAVGNIDLGRSLRVSSRANPDDGGTRRDHGTGCADDGSGSADDGSGGANDGSGGANDGTRCYGSP